MEKEKKKYTSMHRKKKILGKGNLFATGLVAGGALAGVLVAFLFANDNDKCNPWKMER